MKTNIIILLTAIFLFALTLFCANQVAPSGGPEDKTPPAVAAVTPENGQTNVGPNTRITVTFSEWIATAGAAGAVSVYPPLEGGFDVRAAKNRITVIPKTPFKDNTTYHIVIGTTLRDLRNNAITQPINIVFSTGNALDKGRIEGKVVSQTRFVRLPRVALYWEDESWENAKYFSPPDYMAECDSSGAFKFSYLREGRYRVVGFDDQYRIRRLRMGDTCFTSLEQSINITRNAQRIRLYPALSDTAVVVDTVGIDTVSVDTVSIDTISTDAVSVDTVNIDTISTDTISVDTTIIDIASIDTISIDTVTIDTTGIDTLEININKSESNMADTAEVDTAKSKSKVAPKPQICYKLSGGADCLEPNEKRKWTYIPQGRDTTTFTVRDSAGTFSFDSIPASKGTLLWFIDDNDDNQITPGKLVPWRSPERFFVVPTLIEAKANWEIVDLKVEACEEELGIRREEESEVRSEESGSDGGE
jgi:hypothetical protein